jgi:hypothetical protein
MEEPCCAIAEAYGRTVLAAAITHTERWFKGTCFWFQFFGDEVGGERCAEARNHVSRFERHL